MCLTKLRKTDFAPEKEGVGYKGLTLVVDSEGNEHLISPYQGSLKELPVGVWLDEKDYRDENKAESDIIGSRFRYENGFHICRSLRAAKVWGNVVYKASFKEIVAEGKNEWAVVYVVRKMMLTEKVCKGSGIKGGFLRGVRFKNLLIFRKSIQKFGSF